MGRVGKQGGIGRGGRKEWKGGDGESGKGEMGREMGRVGRGDGKSGKGEMGRVGRGRWEEWEGGDGESGKGDGEREMGRVGRAPAHPGLQLCPDLFQLPDEERPLQCLLQLQTLHLQLVGVVSTRGLG